MNLIIFQFWLYNLTINNYNDLLKYNKDFYNHIPTETFLVFQTDTVIFKNYKHLINNFLHYDYVGAPWYRLQGKNERECVGNGGLSLRKKSKMLEIMEKTGINNYPEDLYFSCCEYVPINKPSFNDALSFSVEEVSKYNNISFGCHKPWVIFDNNNKYSLYNKYEEVKEIYKYNNVPPPASPAPIKPDPPKRYKNLKIKKMLRLLKFR